jgi:4-hydroxy 2-oxovalerate aldolase
MQSVKILDCTLRDGGFVVNMDFGKDVISGIINKLYKANIDIIECGFLKDITYQDGITLFRHVEQIASFLPKEKRNDISFVALLDYGRYSLSNLSPYDGSSINGIRICFVKEDNIEDVLKFARMVGDKGYQVYLQPTAILSYTDMELLRLVEKVNILDPYAFSIVDTFGSMYEEDLLHIYTITNKNLLKTINLGFHSHNNLQLSFALCQKFIQLSFGNRNIFVDTSVHGLGRGAGNSCTELVSNYLNEKYNRNYGFDSILDIEDIYMPSIVRRGTWGYSVPFMLAGKLNTHVNNISYLLDKHNIDTIDLLNIISVIDPIQRKKYNYDYLENLYVEYFNNDIDDEALIQYFTTVFNNKNILLVAPGASLEREKDIIDIFIVENKPVVININVINPYFEFDYIFFSSNRRFKKAQREKKIFNAVSKIITSNIKTNNNNIDNTFIINYDRLIKKGWIYFDNSLILLLRFLDLYTPKEIAIAGFDGFSLEHNYILNMDFSEPIKEEAKNEILNRELGEMLLDYKKTRRQTTSIRFITKNIFSRFFDP